MIRVTRFLVAVLFVSLAVASAHARLGDKLSQLKQRFGPPAPESRKNTALWFFEAKDGRLAYNVTFNSKGESIAEGLKPVKLGRLTREMAEDFIQSQIEPYRNSETLRTVQPGEKYEFAGQGLVCGENERVYVDDPNGVLVIWTQGGIPTVLAVRPEMISGVPPSRGSGRSRSPCRTRRWPAG